MFKMKGEFRTIKQLLEGAEQLAQQSGESLPGAEHLLLAALALPDGTARRAFERLGVDPAGLPSAIAAQHDEALRAVGIKVEAKDLDTPAPEARGVYLSTASAQTAFKRAVELSGKPKPRRLRGAHVVLAVTEMEHGTVARALSRLGVDREHLAAAARQELASPAT
jgi:ATP-dependent Clp protease ATP-binding subunit ClpA